MSALKVYRRYTCIMNLWEHLESKSSAIKAQYAFGVASVVTILIAVVWMSTLPAHFSQKFAPEVEKKEDSKGFSEILSDTKNQLGNIIEGTKKTDVPQVETSNMNALNGDLLPDESDVASGSTETLQIDSATPEVSTPSVRTLVENEASVQIESASVEITTQASPRVILIGTTTNRE